MRGKERLVALICLVLDESRCVGAEVPQVGLTAEE